MNKEIAFSGIASVPDDYQSPDGQLSLSFNLLSEDGSLRPLAQPSTVLDIAAHIVPDPPIVFNPQQGTGYRPTVEIAYIHSTPLFRHYIVLQHNESSDNIHWLDADADPDTYALSSANRLAASVSALRFSSVGNTLTVALPDGITYFKWDEDNATYKDLSQRPPMVHLQFSLSENKKAPFDNTGLNYVSSSAPEESFTAWSDTGIKLTDTFEVYTHPTGQPAPAATNRLNVIHDTVHSFTQAVWALINKSNALITEQGHFYAPFFVRYAYRLFDGSLWMHSAPVFMPVCSPKAFNVTFANTGCLEMNYNFIEGEYIIRYDKDHLYITGNDNIFFKPGSNTVLNYTPRNVSLEYNIINNDALTALSSDWADIVKSVDIFVSQPLIRERSDKDISSVSVTRNGGYRLNNGNITDLDDLNDREETDRNSPWYLRDDSSSDPLPDALCNVNVDIPLLSTDEYLHRIQSVASFFKVASYNITDFTGSGTREITIESSILPNLTVQEAMTDDYHSHNSLLPVIDNDGNCLTSLFSYNSRQVIAGLSERLYEGFPIAALLPKQSSFIYNNDYISVSHVYVTLDTQQGRRVVDCPVASSYTGIHALFCCPIFYPDNRAVQMDVAVTVSGVQKLYRFPMHQHPFLNGSITDGHILTESATSFDVHDYVQPQLSDIITLINYIYNSEINNPFVFLPSNITRIPTGRILAVSTAAKALSQGQFGQFPLYAFCSDGVWAMQVANDGSFSARQPITRDVCTDPDSITQLDSSVLFATSRGIMLLSGSEATCITDTIASDSPFSLVSFPRLAALDFPLPAFVPFAQFIADSRMLYDYRSQRIYLFNTLRVDNPTTEVIYPLIEQDEHSLPYFVTKHHYSPLYPYAYVYSLKSKQWGMVSSNLASVLNAYPDSLAQTHDKRLVSFSPSQQSSPSQPSSDDDPVAGLLVTRPLKLGIPYDLKTVNELILRGVFARGDVQPLLYGSRDLIHWHLIATSADSYLRHIQGTPYKYFILAALTSLSPTQSLASATVRFSPRHTNRLH